MVPSLDTRPGPRSPAPRLKWLLGICILLTTVSAEVSTTAIANASSITTESISRAVDVDSSTESTVFQSTEMGGGNVVAIFGLEDDELVLIGIGCVGLVLLMIVFCCTIQCQRYRARKNKEKDVNNIDKKKDKEQAQIDAIPVNMTPNLFAAHSVHKAYTPNPLNLERISSVSRVSGKLSSSPRVASKALPLEPAVSGASAGSTLEPHAHHSYYTSNSNYSSNPSTVMTATPPVAPGNGPFSSIPPIPVSPMPVSPENTGVLATTAVPRAVAVNTKLWEEAEDSVHTLQPTPNTPSLGPMDPRRGSDMSMFTVKYKGKNEVESPAASEAPSRRPSQLTLMIHNSDEASSGDDGTPTTIIEDEEDDVAMDGLEAAHMSYVSENAIPDTLTSIIMQHKSLEQQPVFPDYKQ